MTKQKTMEMLAVVLTHKPQSRQDLCKRIGCNDRMLRAAVMELRTIGYPVCGWNNDSAYWMIEGSVRIDQIDGYENICPYWCVSDGILVGGKGEVKGSWSRSRKYPYNSVTLRTKDGRKVHKRKDRIIAIACVDGRTSSRNEVDHINGNHADDSPENLRWVSRKENMEFQMIRQMKNKRIVKKNIVPEEKGGQIGWENVLHG